MTYRKKRVLVMLLTLTMLSTNFMGLSGVTFGQKRGQQVNYSKLSTITSEFVDILDLNYWINKMEANTERNKKGKWRNISSAIDEGDLPGVKVPLLMYHEISVEKPGKFAVTPDKFRDDMSRLKKAGYTTIFLDDLYNYLATGKEMAEKPIVVTFDDGYVSNYDYAYPIAKDLDIKITISMIGWSVGRDTFRESDKKITPHFSYEAAKEMYESGYVDIQSHTFDLHTRPGVSYGYKMPCNLGMLKMEDENEAAYKKRVTEDLMRLNVEMHEGLGRIPSYIFYPYGAFGKDTEQVIDDLGFKGSVTIKPGVRKYQSVEDMKAMPRINIPNTLAGDDFIKTIEALPLIQEMFYNDK